MSTTLPPIASPTEAGWLMAYCNEVRFQAEYGVLAWADIQACATRNDRWIVSFVAVHSLLTAAGNLDKLFRGSSPQKDTAALKAVRDWRKKQLRIIFGSLVDGPALAASRKLRNHLEHFDERIDLRVVQQKTKGGNPWTHDHFVIPRDPQIDAQYTLTGQKPIRLLDPTTWECFINGDQFNVASLASECQAIRDAAVEIRMKIDAWRPST